MRTIKMMILSIALAAATLASAQVGTPTSDMEGFKTLTDPLLAVRCKGEQPQALPLKQGEDNWGLSFETARADATLNDTDTVLSEALSRLALKSPLAAREVSGYLQSFRSKLVFNQMTHDLGGRIDGLPDNCTVTRAVRFVRSPVDHRSVVRIIVSDVIFSQLDSLSKAALILEGALMDRDLSRFWSPAFQTNFDLDYLTAFLLSDQLAPLSYNQFIDEIWANRQIYPLTPWIELSGGRLVYPHWQTNCFVPFTPDEKISFRSQRVAATDVCFDENLRDITFVSFAIPYEIEFTKRKLKLIVKKINVSRTGDEIATLGADHQKVSDPNHVLELDASGSLVLSSEGKILRAKIHSGQELKAGKWVPLEAGDYDFVNPHSDFDDRRGLVSTGM